MTWLARFLALLALVVAVAGLGLRGFFPPGGPPGPRPEPSVPGGEIPPDFDPGPFLARAAESLKAAELGAEQQAAFPDPATRKAPPASPLIPLLFPPTQFRASAREGGVRLSWQAHPENPVPHKSYRVTRWQGDGEAVLVGETTAMELLDQVECEGISYHYHLRAVVRREILEGQTATRESSPATVAITLPPTIRWSAGGLENPDRIILAARRTGRPSLGPFPASPGEEIGDTGWFLEALRVRETEVLVETRTPRFDGLGRRVIINGQPADRIRETKVLRLLASVRLSDPCGTAWDLELLLPEETAWPDR